MKLLLRCHLDPYDGDAIDLIYALQKRGVEVHLEPRRVVTPLPADIAVLLTRDRADGYDLALHLGEPMLLGTEGSKAGVTVAWTYADHNSTRPGRLTEILIGYDLVAAYDMETVTALAPWPDSVEQTTIMGGYAHRDWPYTERDWYGERFAFCIVGDPPPQAQAAFDRLRSRHPDELDAAELNRYDGDPSDLESLEDFYARQHVLIVPQATRNTAALQFLSTGGTVIAARGGAAQQWLSSALGYPADFTTDSLTTVMRTVHNDRDTAKRRGETASTLIPDMCSWDKVIDRLFTVISDRVPGNGERLVHTARVAAERARERNRR